RRMMQVDIKGIDEYIARLKSDPDECRQLGKEFLIGVTKFFRDNEAYDVLNDAVLSKLVAEKDTYETIKVWVCACSTGEEAYSLAITLNELVEESDKEIDIKIFATDIEQAS